MRNEAASWYVAKNKKKLGPFSWDQLQQMAVSDMLAPTDMVLQEGAQKWAAADSISGLTAVRERVTDENLQAIHATKFDSPCPADHASRDASLPPTLKLIPCPACGETIAPSAATCPRCGAANTWLHPEIQRFQNSTHSFAHMPPFKVDYRHFVITGCAEVKRGVNAINDFSMKIGGIGLLCMVFAVVLPNSSLATLAWVIGPLGLMAGIALMVIGFFQKSQPTDFVVTFAADFSKTPPEWRSDDDEFWKDIKAFFFNGTGAGQGAGKANPPTGGKT